MTKDQIPMTKEARSTKHYALCIGINEYPDAPLAGCVNDAHDWAEIFGRAADDVEVLLDRQATRDGILAAVERMYARAEPGSWLFFAFSGHGSRVRDRDGDERDRWDECLCPYDYRRRLILDDEIGEVIARRPKDTRLVLVSDSCHARTLCKALLDGTPVTWSPQARYLDPALLARAEGPRGKPPALPALPAGVIHLAGCQPAEYSYDGEFAGRPNGALSRAAIDSLARLRVPTFANWARAIARRLPSGDYPQRPALDAGKTERQWTIPFRAK